MFSNPTLTDEQLKEIAQIKSLQSLILDDTSVTDAGIAYLGLMTVLYELRLFGTKITDANAPTPYPNSGPAPVE
jgi:hypothetical protein